MKKLLTLLMLLCMVCTGAWAQQTLKASLNSTSRVHVYKMHPRNESGNYWLTSQLGSTLNVSSAGDFIFIPAEGEDNYYIYSVTEQKWLTYDNTSISNGENKVSLSETKGNYFKFVFGSATGNGAIGASWGLKNGYLIKAVNSNGTVSSQCLNWHGGPGGYNNNAKRIGFYSDGFGDAGCIWVLEENLVIGSDNSNFTEGWYQIQVSDGTFSQHEGYKGKYLRGVPNGNWGVTLTDDASDEKTCIYVTKDGSNFKFEFNKGTADSYYAAQNSYKNTSSAGALTFTVKEENANNYKWKIWGGSNKWCGWNIDNIPSIGITSGNETQYQSCYYTFHKVADRFTPQSPASVTTGWYQIKWVDVNDDSANGMLNASQVKNKYVKNHETDATVGSAKYPFYLDTDNGAPATLDEIAQSLVYVNRANANVSTAANIKSTNGHYAAVNGQANTEPQNLYIIYRSQGSFPVGSAITSGTSGNRYSWTPYETDGIKYIRSGNQNKFPISEFSRVNPQDYGLVPYIVVISNGKDGDQITYNGSSNYGIDKVYNNGTLFFDAAAVIESNDFSAPEGSTINSCSIDNSSHTITIVLWRDLADGIYEINNQNGSNSRGYFVHSDSYPNAPVLAETQLSGYTDRDVTDDRHDGTVNPYFGVKTIENKTYIYSLANGKFLHSSWSETAIGYVMALSTRNASYVTLQNTNQSGNQFLCNACGNSGGVDGHTVYTTNHDGGNDFVFEPVDASKVAELRGTYASQIEAAEFAINGGWNMVYTGLTSPAEGGVTYLCTNYTGEKIMLPLNLDRDGLIAMHVSGYNGHIESVNTETHTITVAYDQNYTKTSVLWDGNGDASNTKVPAARIPAMIKAHNGDILAFSDWRYSRDDVGRDGNFHLGYQVDIEMRRSRDGGQTWSPAIIAANGDGSNDRTTAGYGDASVVADSESDNVLLMCVNAAGSNRFVRFTSSNNGETWSGPTNIASDIATVAPTSTFFTSGKMIQAKTFKKTDASFKRIYAPLCGGNAGDYVLYSDDFGQNWSRLGEGAAQTGSSDECRLIELPNGDILLESRGDGRFVNVFHYTNKETGEGSWGTQGQKTGTPATACNGDLDLVEAYPMGSNEAKLLLLEVAPRSGGPRSHVKYYYKEVNATPENDTYTNEMFVGGWTAGYEVCAGKSAYSSILNLGNGIEAILYEKAHSESETGSSGNPWGYDIKFEKHDISLITNGNYFGVDPTGEKTIKYTLTDVNGATYEGETTGEMGTAPTFTGCYGMTFNTASWGMEGEKATYAANVVFPFPVSSNNVTKHVNLVQLPNYDRYWSYNGTDDKVAMQFSQSNTSDKGSKKSNQTNYQWTLTPVLNGTNFGFYIYSVGAQKYVTAANATANSTMVTLAETGDAFSLSNKSNNPQNASLTSNGVFTIVKNGTTYSINIESATNTTKQFTFWTGGEHAGKNVAIVEAPDFTALENTLRATYDMVGTGFGKYGASDASKVTAAQNVLDNVNDKYASDFRVANDELAEVLTLNMPQAGQFLRIKGANTQCYISGNGTSGVVKLIADKNENSILYYDGTKLIGYKNGLGFNETHSVASVGTTFETHTFSASPYSVGSGYYLIKSNYSGSKTLCDGGSATDLNLNRWGTDNAIRSAWILEEVETLPITLPSSGYTTLYSPVSLTLPEGLEAFIAILNEENATVFYSGRSEVPANTGVLLRGTASTQYDLPVNGTTEATESDLLGKAYTQAYNKDNNTLANESLENKYVYTLQSGTFKYYTGTKLTGFKAHYELHDGRETGNVRQYSFNFDEGMTTGVAEIEGMVNAKATVFDLSGRRLEKVAKGINIVNGKKVIR